MDDPDITQPSPENPFDLLQSIGLAACLRYGALVGLVFGISMGTTLAVPRASYFSGDDIIMRCFARGIFGGAELGVVFGLAVGGLIAGFRRRSLRFQASGTIGGLHLMELRSLETSWRERAPYVESMTTTIFAYTLRRGASAGLL